MCTCSTFSNISETATVFFLSGFNFQYISRAAFLTPLSKRVSVHSFFTSSKFSRVMPENKTAKVRDDDGDLFPASVKVKVITCKPMDFMLCC